MSKNIILDASALLALLNQEKGAEQVEKHLPNVIMSSVNVAEVVVILNDLGIMAHEIELLINDIVKEIIPFDSEQAFITAILRKNTKPYGLSLGDRACLSLAKQKKLPVLTADKVWGKLNLSFDIHIIR